MKLLYRLAPAPKGTKVPHSDVPSDTLLRKAGAFDLASQGIPPVDPTVNDNPEDEEDPLPNDTAGDVLTAVIPVEVRAKVKSGYKTTEFGLTALVSILTAVGAIPMPEHYKAYVIGGLTAVYAVSRAVAKAAALLGLPKATAPQGPEA